MTAVPCMPAPLVDAIAAFAAQVQALPLDHQEAVLAAHVRVLLAIQGAMIDAHQAGATDQAGQTATGVH